MRRLKRFEARVQFLAVEDEVKSMISKGYSYRMIHESLTTTGRISISYDTFYNYLRKKKELVKGVGVRTATPFVEVPASPSAGAGTARKKFVHNSTPPNDLV
jgi:hypothetical protein